ncbi:MAG: hypothetical protein ACH0QD_13190 [Tepidibacillus sp.]
MFQSFKIYQGGLNKVVYERVERMYPWLLYIEKNEIPFIAINRLQVNKAQIEEAKQMYGLRPLELPQGKFEQIILRSREFGLSIQDIDFTNQRLYDSELQRFKHFALSSQNSKALYGLTITHQRLGMDVSMIEFSLHRELVQLYSGMTIEVEGDVPDIKTFLQHPVFLHLLGLEKN